MVYTIICKLTQYRAGNAKTKYVVMQSARSLRDSTQTFPSFCTLANVAVYYRAMFYQVNV